MSRLTLLLVVLSVACTSGGSDDSHADGGNNRPDAGHSEPPDGDDAGSEERDAGPGRDAGSAPRDAGQRADAQVPPGDAGKADAGADAGVLPSADAGPDSEDAGSLADAGAGELVDSGSYGLDAQVGVVDAGDAFDASFPIDLDAALGDAGSDGGAPDAGPGQAPLLALGHVDAIARLRQSGDRILSQDVTGHYILWDVSAREAILEGQADMLNGQASVELVASTIAIVTPQGVDLRTVSDGTLLATLSTTLAADGRFGLATDGSYFWSADSQGIDLWSTEGTLLVTRAGDYSQARFSALPAAFSVALGPAGARVVETFDVASGTRSTFSFASGTFHSWFVDGEHFLTSTGTTVWVYTSSGTRIGAFALSTLENLTGQGSYFWIHQASANGSPLTLYRVDGAGAAAGTYSLHTDDRLIAAGPDVLAILPEGTGSVDVLTLGSTITRTSQTVPVAYLEAFASDGWDFSVGNRHGVIFDSINLSGSEGPKALSRGAVKAVAGSSAGWAAVALSDGSIELIDASGDEAQRSDALDFASSGVAMPDDASSLFAQADTDDGPYALDRSIVQFSLYDGARLATWAYNYGSDPTPQAFTISRSGNVLALLLGTSGGSADWSVFDAASEALLWSAPAVSDVLRISPDGVHYAMPDSAPSDTTVTRLYTSAGLADAAEGWAVGWFDDARLLINRYERSGGAVTFAGAELFDVSGAAEPTGLPELTSIVPLSATEVFAPDLNVVLDVASGAELWSTDEPLQRTDATGDVSAVAGDFVIYATGRALHAQPWH